MQELKVGYATISSEEYKELILKEKELNDVKETNNDLVITKIGLEKEIEKLEQELKDLLLAIVRGENTTYDNKFQSYDINSNLEILEYINGNYLKHGFLQFRKVEKEKEVNE